MPVAFLLIPAEAGARLGHCAPLLLLLLLLHTQPSTCGHQGSHSALYDPYHLNDEPLKAPQPEKLAEATAPNAATLKAYRTYYLILVRNLSRVLEGLQQHGLLDPDKRLALSLDTWTVDSDALRRLQAAGAEGAEPCVADLQDANSFLLSLFGKLKLPVGAPQSHSRGWLLSPDFTDYLAPLAAISVSFAAAVWFVLRRIRVWQLLALVFFLSWACNWARLYQTALAQRQHAVATLNCRPADEPLGFWESLGMWISARTSVTAVKDDCLRKLEALAVSPIWDASPLEAAADLLANVVLNRFVQVAQAINLGYRSLIDGLPVWHSVFITLLVLALPGLLMLIRYGYRLRLGFGLLHLGPEIAPVPHHAVAVAAAAVLPPPPPAPIGAGGDGSNQSNTSSAHRGAASPSGGAAAAPSRSRREWKRSHSESCVR